MDVKIMIKLGSNDNDPIRMKRVDQIQNKKNNDKIWIKQCGLKSNNRNID